MPTESAALDYTRVTDDAAILCRRKDFPRAANVLQRRRPDHRRWRQAFRHVAVTADRGLDGARRSWMEAALREVVGAVPDRWLRGELVVDARALHATLDLGPVLPTWTARDLWRFADDEGIPMEYVARVTPLPHAIGGTIDTAQVILDFRQTASAHRDHAVELARALPVVVIPTALDGAARSALVEVQSHQDATRRWRSLAQRLLGAG